jgi:hypothetical protein
MARSDKNGPETIKTGSKKVKKKGILSKKKFW